MVVKTERGKVLAVQIEKKERIDQGKEKFSQRKEEHKRFVIEDCNLF